MIQDIHPHIFQNQYRPDAQPKEEDHVVIYQNGSFLLDVESKHKTIAFPDVTELDDVYRENLVYLFSIDNEAFYLLRGLAKIDSERYDFFSMRELRSREFTPKRYIFAIFTAYHLVEWYNANIYCSHCGTKMQYDTLERSMFCPDCEKKVYPRINPAVIIGITNGDKLLLTKYRAGYANYALVAGFTEIGETLEETVAREVMEEVGLKVKNIRYYKSQPWGIAADLLAGFFCDVDGNDEIRLDETELKYAEWVKRKDIVLQPLPYSLTNEMMQVFQNGEI